MTLMTTPLRDPRAAYACLVQDPWDVNERFTALIGALS
ncbi:Uncharacterised protein [Mycobacteroides abscessus subsp. abscessus]|uniref:Uncharacterized protein n=1 Tax=Dermabacter vaginalis TaxID=1630135 RepID=A0A1B0ZG37_9MICO|nr:hypothetical protein DAD186_03520 [Dermabacter vaginalis]SHX11697.1 Uncharacterised protein [Mycobacteroides abscessus subsp. abscessus]